MKLKLISTNYFKYFLGVCKVLTNSVSLCNCVDTYNVNTVYRGFYL